MTINNLIKGYRIKIYGCRQYYPVGASKRSALRPLFIFYNQLSKPEQRWVIKR